MSRDIISETYPKITKQIIPGLSAILLSLASAISWGAGDFNGGYITKRVNVFILSIISQAFGALFLLALALIFREPIPVLTDLVYGAIAGI